MYLPETLNGENMDWSDLAEQVIGLGAPVLGNALGGPLGGLAGKILAESLGAKAPTPAAVNDALAKAQANPAAAPVADAARAAEANWLSALAEAGKLQVGEVGQTMRTEAVSSDRSWRPLYALELTLLECPGFAVVLGHGLWNGDADIINGLANLSGLIMTYMAARFGVLGVYVSGRTREKQAAVTGETVPSIVAQVVKAITKRK
jgi:hypothetical protein